MKDILLIIALVLSILKIFNLIQISWWIIVAIFLAPVMAIILSAIIVLTVLDSFNQRRR